MMFAKWNNFKKQQLSQDGVLFLYGHSRPWQHQIEHSAAKWVKHTSAKHPNVKRQHKKWKQKIETNREWGFAFLLEKQRNKQMLGQMVSKIHPCAIGFSELKQCCAGAALAHGCRQYKWKQSNGVECCGTCGVAVCYRFVGTKHRWLQPWVAD